MTTPIFIGHDSLSAGAENTFMGWKGNKLGYGIVMDFYTQMAIEGRIYQVRAGSISAPLVGDQPLADTKAEMCADALAATTMIPVSLMIGINLGTGTLHEYGAKSVATVSSAGTAFTPLNLKSDGPAPTITARVDAAGGVTVTAELVTTTLEHWQYSNPLAIVTAGGGTQPLLIWEPKAPPVLVGPRCFYAQITATGTGPSYYAHFDVIQLPTANVS